MDLINLVELSYRIFICLIAVRNPTKRNPGRMGCFDSQLSGTQSLMLEKAQQRGKLGPWSPPKSRATR